jgi:C4-dicarboxylate-specific signal transduction histidine kinase
MTLGSEAGLSLVGECITPATDRARRGADLGAFLMHDPRGRLLPDFLTLLEEHWSREHAELLKECEALLGHVQHIKEVVKRQQALSGLSGLVESASVTRIIEDALTINAAALAQSGISVQRELADLPPLLLDGLKLGQILVNPIRNAQEALGEAAQVEKRRGVRSQCLPDGQLCIEVIDNGPGLTPEQLQQLFTHGFTTKQHGHGLGLHASFFAAREMDGTLSGHSDGPGRGARFTVLLPVRRPEQGQEAA